MNYTFTFAFYLLSFFIDYILLSISDIIQYLKTHPIHTPGTVYHDFETKKKNQLSSLENKHTIHTWSYTCSSTLMLVRCLAPCLARKVNSDPTCEGYNRKVKSWNCIVISKIN